ncbi:MAG: hypothetical protein J6T18_05335 [Bacteroidaceae bacterium]|nr:hypothetical protein [Bacteroidaceae bacterium]
MKTVCYAAVLVFGLSTVMVSCGKHHNKGGCSNINNEKMAKASVITYGVDLGLSVNWAESNVGANSPEEFGYQIPYGNISGSIYYSQNTPANISGTISDIAVKQMGDGWRMPTEVEMRELIERCEMTIDVINDVKGVRLTGKNGKSIFLPACGSGLSAFWDDEEKGTKYRIAEPQTVGNIGYYWTGSELGAGRLQIEKAREMGFEVISKADPAVLTFNITKKTRSVTSESAFRNCFPVRAVHEK